ncbi:hypothetical protein SAZ10_00520 [Mesorhizobium sp. BAC0120]|uniref:hypothetical protein n=1 Tax=Mesorhizobium sp. BAC0120 TaxID=3090670 RepID=UPI00298C119B|nr:hypothetical protein [Mesorhizobium sp. BAC0120]MDW6020239.1 hypothetical protein [Mesorhizobium sp. BAC0120]
MTLIQFAEYAPDRSPFDANFCDRIENCLPISGGYGPFPAFSPISAPLPERPQGSYLAYVINGNYQLFAGTKSKLFKFDGAQLAWIDVSKPGGYATPESERWSFVQYGSWLIATNGVDPVQYIDVATPLQFADLSADAPRARQVGTIGDFVMLAHLNTSQRMVQWSGLNQPQFWKPRQRSSDFQEFPDGGEIMGFAGGVNGCVIFHAESVREGRLALDTSMVMTFQQTITNHGCMAPQSVVATGSGIFYLSDDGFYRYNNPVPDGIGVERIDNTFLNDISRQEIYNVYGSEDPNRKIVYWAYRSLENPKNNSYDKVLLYHYGINRWSLIKPGTIMTGLVEATAAPFTLDSLSSLGIPLDQLPYSLDSRAWSGGTPAIAAFDTDFRLGFFSGDPLQAVLQTGDGELTTGRRSFVRGFRPLADAPAIKGRVAVKDSAGAARTWLPEADTSARTGLIPARASGRFHRFEVTIPAGTIWTAVHGVDPDGGEEGQQ